MKIYKCPRCGHTANQKNDLRKHFLRKNYCQVTLQNISIAECIHIILNGKNEYRYKKFENDYWATSIDELIKKADFKTDKVIKITTCGFFNNSAVKLYLKNRPNSFYTSLPPDRILFA